MNFYFFFNCILSKYWPKFKSTDDIQTVLHNRTGAYQRESSNACTHVNIELWNTIFLFFYLYHSDYFFFLTFHSAHMYLNLIINDSKGGSECKVKIVFLYYVL